MAKKRAAKRRPLKKVVARAKVGAKKRQVRRKKRRATILDTVKAALGMKK